MTVHTRGLRSTAVDCHHIHGVNNNHRHKSGSLGKAARPQEGFVVRSEAERQDHQSQGHLVGHEFAIVSFRGANQSLVDRGQPQNGPSQVLILIIKLIKFKQKVSSKLPRPLRKSRFRMQLSKVEVQLFQICFPTRNDFPRQPTR